MKGLSLYISFDFFLSWTHAFFAFASYPFSGSGLKKLSETFSSLFCVLFVSFFSLMSHLRLQTKISTLWNFQGSQGFSVPCWLPLFSRACFNILLSLTCLVNLFFVLFWKNFFSRFSRPAESFLCKPKAGAGTPSRHLLPVLSLCASIQSSSRSVMSCTPMAIVDILCRKAETDGGRIPATPSTIRKKLNPIMKW